MQATWLRVKARPVPRQLVPGRGAKLAKGRQPRIVGEVETGMTFVDGLGVGDVKDVAIRDRRHLSEDGVLIVVATVSENGAASSSQPELIARGFGDTGPLLDELRKRVGQTFTLEQLATVYADAERWSRDAAFAGAPETARPEDVATVEDAAFHLYARGAVDYVP